MAMERTFAFLNESFLDYYRTNELVPPPDFTKREFGFLYHGQTFFRRHLGFPDPEAVMRDIRKRTPAHVYYSTALYENPSGHRMSDKGWLGADLIFDLDADHITGADKMNYTEMLAAVKIKFKRLVDDFLVGDLGYSERDLFLVFSGSRGYHAHIRDPRVRPLNSVARRQLVDYITKNVPASAFVSTPPVGKTGFRVIRSLRIPKKEVGGWGGRLTRAVHSDLESIARDSRPVDERAKDLSTRTGLQTRESRAVVSALAGPWSDVKKILDGIEKGMVDLHEGVGPQTMSRLVDHHFENLKGWCDEPVSSDVKRLIRAPGSLHGKTGLRAVPLTRDKLDDFDPLVEAVALDEEPVKITAAPTAKPFTLKGEDFKPVPGPMTLPRFAAVFLILRRQALLEGDTPPAPPPATPAAAASKPG